MIKSFRYLILTVILLGGSVGCGEDPERESRGHSSANRRYERIKTETVTINGRVPADYYAQFLYRIVGSCEKDVWFNYLSMNSVVITQTQSGSDVRADLEVYLFDNHTYKASFEEHIVKRYSRRGYSFDYGAKHRLEGRWEISGGNLHLSNLGMGSAITINERDAVSIEFHGSNSYGLEGHKSVLRYVSGTAGLQSFNEYCGRD